MPSYVALLRGIAPSNPNMRNEKLRGVFERLGYDNVRSVISSGNILFESDDTDVPTLETRIEEALQEDLGITSTTIIRNHQDLEDLIASDPFPGLVHGKQTYLTVTFLKHRHTTPAEPSELPTHHGSTIVLTHAATGALCAVTDTTTSSTPDLMRMTEKALGRDITTRTWKTVERICARLASA